jgi:hypothetical protein
MTTPEGAKGWDDLEGSAHSRQAVTADDVTPDASPEGIRAEARTREQEGNGDEPSNVPTARRIELRRAIILTRLENKLVVLTPDELEELLNGYEHGRFQT